MRMKLLLTAALVGTLAAPAMADKPKPDDGPEKRIDLVDPKKPDVEPPEVKTRRDLDSVAELFSIGDGELGTTEDGLPLRDGNPPEFLQQQRVLQEGNRNRARVDQTSGSQGLASIQQSGNRNTASTTQSDTDTPPGSVPFSFPANVSVTTQTGDGNRARVEQYGSAGEKPYANRADIHQFAPEHFRPVTNDAYVSQYGNDNTLATITQGLDDSTAGIDNAASVYQTANDGSFVGINQARDGNEAIVHQSETGTEFPGFLRSSVEVQQVSGIGFGVGEANYAYIDQFNGVDLAIEVYQEQTGAGGPNDIYISQTGISNGIWVDQIGSDNYMDLDQSGLKNRIEASQDDNGQALSLWQDGVGNTFYSHQGEGDYNEILNARQTGELNLVSISQKGNENKVNDLYQGGFFNTMLLEQEGNRNTINASQADTVSFDVISVSQQGNGNVATTSQ
ncbi:MAG: hypothetical protein AAFV54_12645 [Pseudomonadota bacterium]